MRSIATGVMAAVLAVPALAADRPVDTRLYWGDTHLHTSNSFDVYLFGTPGSTPDTAFHFARGLPVVSPTTGVRWQLRTTLDFLVVSDQAEMIGSIPRLYKGDPVIADTETGRALLKISPDKTVEQLQHVYDQRPRRPGRNRYQRAAVYRRHACR